MFKHHTAEVTGVTLQPCGEFFCSCSHDSTWCFYDIPSARVVQTVACGLESACDGMMCRRTTRNGAVPS